MSNDTEAAHGTDEPAADRLDSWKEIASFLRRDVRTVQRWEKQAGLPVHRHAASRLRTAYAYRSELEAWWQRQQQSAPADPRETPVEPERTVGPPRPPWLLPAAAVLGVAVTLVAATWIGAAPEVPPARVAGRPLTVLLSSVDDGARDPELATLLEDALARQAARHPGLELLSPDRVRRALRLMKLDPPAGLTLPVAREVGQRDGAVDLVLAARVHRVQDRYYLDLEVVDPAGGRPLATLARHDVDRHSLLTGLYQECGRFVERVGRTAPDRRVRDYRLEPVRTASFEALQLYTAAVRAGTQRKWRASELLARRAAAADEEFAAAHAWAAFAARRQGWPIADLQLLLERATRLSAGAADDEAYFLSGLVEAVAGNVGAAIAAFEALLRVDPTHVAATELLIDLYSSAGRTHEAVELAVARSDAAPDDFYAAVRAAHAVTTWQGDLSAARHLLDRGRRLADERARRRRPVWSVWLALQPAFERWMAADPAGGVAVLASFEQRLNGALGRERDAQAVMVGLAHLAFGQRQAAERVFQYATKPARQLALATMALSEGDEAGLRRWLQDIRQHSDSRPALFARAGLIREARAGLERIRPSAHEHGIRQATLGLIASQQGRSEQAVEALTQATELLRFSGEPEYFLAVEGLSRLAARKGDLDQAARLLNDALAQRARTYGGTSWTAALWLKLNADLIDLYDRQGRAAEAGALASSIRTLMALADPGHPVLARLLTRSHDSVVRATASRSPVAVSQSDPPAGSSIVRAGRGATRPRPRE